MAVFERCGHCGCTHPGTPVYLCPACFLHFCAVCGQALSVNTFTYCPGCGSMKLRDRVRVGRIGGEEDPA